jgi:fatty-acyl-CoA synthase
MSTLYSLLAGAPADAPCLRTGDLILTYGEFRDRVRRAAGGLQRAGLSRGDCLALWLPNTSDWLVLAFACARSGINVLSVNLRFGPNEIGDFIARAQCKAIAYAPRYAGKDHEALLAAIDPAQLATVRVAVTSDGARSGLEGRTTLALQDLLAGDPDGDELAQGTDPCIVFSSSGTTSKPKLIVHSQERTAQHARDVAPVLGLDAPDARGFLGVPFCGAFGYAVAISCFAGACCISVEEAFDPRRAVELLDAHRITNMFGTNDMLDRMIDVATPHWKPAHLRTVVHANFTPGLHQLPPKAEAHGLPLRGAFGMSEIFGLFSNQRPDAPLARRAESGGVPNCPTAKVRVRNPDTGVLLPVGEHGELEIYTPNVMVGYLGDEAATKKAFTEDGYLKTGDLGYDNGDGGFTHLSRMGDTIRIGGFLVNPLEIEETAMQVPGLAACQVVEVEAAQSTRPVAFVIGQPGYRHDEAALIAHCKARLAIFKVPVRFWEVKEFPVTVGPNGTKVRKTELRQDAQARLRAEAKA